MHCSTLAFALFLIVDSAWLGTSVCCFVGAAYLGLALGAIWLVRAALYLATALFGKHKWSSGRTRWRAWLTFPIVAGLTVALLWWQVPAKLTFYVSHPAMDRWAARAMQAQLGARIPDGWVGLYPLQNAERFPGGARFMVAQDDFGDGEGWAYSPSGPPQSVGEDSYRHFAGSWYRWRRSW